MGKGRENGEKGKGSEGERRMAGDRVALARNDPGGHPPYPYSVASVNRDLRFLEPWSRQDTGISWDPVTVLRNTRQHKNPRGSRPG